MSLLLLTAVSGSAQNTPGTPASFGIDGDLYTGLTTHDWFGAAAPSGVAVFSGADAAKINAQIAAGKNYVFSRKMQYPAYSVQGGYLMLDGLYARDYFGKDTTLDRSIFSTDAKASQNAQNPADWVTNDKGAVLPSKSDIVDAYIHMRREGTSIQQGSPSPLVVYFGASTLSTGGDHHLDFELFKSEVAVKGGKFSNTSLAANTGGRDAWTFNADGSVNSFGSMSFSFSFANSTVSEISIYIWVDYNTFTSVDPAGFDFAPGGQNWNGVQPKGGYGFARIIPNNGEQLPAYGSSNADAIPGPPWGTNNKEEGNSTYNYYSMQYGSGQFAEAALNLTALGVDPALYSSFDPCAPPYRRVMVKTRSSSSFSSALQDFAGPFEFLEAPEVPATIAEPEVLTCTNGTINLTAANAISGAHYVWKDPEGTVISSGPSASVAVTQPGKYTLEASIYEGCPATKEKMEVLQDNHPPVATAAATGVLTNNPESSVLLEGGNEDQSDYPTSFGGSQGLIWQWSGPDGFTSTDMIARVKQEGLYSLTVTESRNGCTATATVNVARIDAITLPVKLKTFTAGSHNGRNDVTWTVSANESALRFELQSSTDGRNFKTAAYVWPSEQKGDAEYMYYERTHAPKVYYRLTMYDKEGSVHYSDVVLVSAGVAADRQLTLLNNPGAGALRFLYRAAQSEALVIKVYNGSGTLLQSRQERVAAGTHPLEVGAHVMPAKRVYVLEVVSETGGRLTATFIQQ